MEEVSLPFNVGHFPACNIEKQRIGPGHGVASARFPCVSGIQNQG